MVMLLCGLAFDLPRQFDLMSAPWRTNVLEGSRMQNAEGRMN
jgi:hypothetical protein